MEGVFFEDQESIQLSGKDLIKAVARVLENMCTSSEVDDSDNSIPRNFFGVKRQKFSLEAYVHRLHGFTDCSNSAFIVALIYLERLHVADATRRITHMNVHRMFSTALLLAIKNHEDEHFANSYYAEVFGMTSVTEVNTLEAKMLAMFEFRLNVSAKEYFFYKSHLLHEEMRIANLGSNAFEGSNMLVSAA